MSSDDVYSKSAITLTVDSTVVTKLLETRKLIDELLETIEIMGDTELMEQLKQSQIDIQNNDVLPFS